MVCFSQVTWQNNYGGTLDDYGNHMVRTSDGGYISISTVSSNDLDISGGLQAHHGGTDIFILKMSNALEAVMTNKGQPFNNCQPAILSQSGTLILMLPMEIYLLANQVERIYAFSE